MNTIAGRNDERAIPRQRRELASTDPVGARHRNGQTESAQLWTVQDLMQIAFPQVNGMLSHGVPAGSPEKLRTFGSQASRAPAEGRSEWTSSQSGSE